MEVDDGMEICTLSVKRKQIMDNFEEYITPSPKYKYAYMCDKSKRKKVDHTNPFAIREYVLGFDSPKYGSVTKDLEDLFLSRKQIPRKFPSLEADSMELEHGKELQIANDYNKHDTNEKQLVVISDSEDDDDEPISQISSMTNQDSRLKIPFEKDEVLKITSKTCQDTVLNKPIEQSTEQFLGGDYAEDQATKEVRYTITTVEPIDENDNILEALSMEVDDKMEICTPYVKRRQIMGNFEENITPSPQYKYVYMSDKSKRKQIDLTNPFAIRKYVLGFDSPKYGSVTKDIEDIFSWKKQRLTPVFRKFPSLGSDSLELKHGKDFLIANDYIKHVTNEKQLVVISDSDDDDDDEPTCQIYSMTNQDSILEIPFVKDEVLKITSATCQDTVLNKPVEQSIEQILGGDYAEDQATKEVGYTITTMEPIAEKDNILEVLSMEVDEKMEIFTPSADSVKLKHGPDFSVTNNNTKHDTNEQEVVVIVDSDDEEESTCQIPSKSCKETELNKPTEQSIEIHLEGNCNQDTKEDGDVDTEKKHDDVDTKKKSDDVDSKKKGVYVGAEDDSTCLIPSIPNQDSLLKIPSEKDEVLEIPSKTCQDKVLDKPIEQSMVPYLGEDDVEDQRTKEVGDTITTVEPIFEKDNILEDGDVVTEKKHDDVDNEKMDNDVDNEKKDNDVDTKRRHGKGEYVGVEDDSDVEESHDDSDGLGNIWEEMSFGLETSKDINLSFKETANEDEKDCDHTFILKDDIGSVCRVCGIIEKSIESIIEYQRPKISKSIRTYHYESEINIGDRAAPGLNGVKLPVNNFSVCDVIADPKHKEQMKPHQVEGFNFLLSNLVCDNPGGCILAHAPGTGKTFLLVSFIKSFMDKYPDARPLVILPKGILGTWKKEFTKWKVDIPLYDFYSLKADGRAQQLEVLKQWANERSILFLGYQQFSSMMCDDNTTSIPADCQRILLKCPSLLILDEGHTARNLDTNILTSLQKIETPRKVVLSGTLYQNHVKEVFNILNLVRPKFLKMESSKVIKRRILSRVPIQSRKNLLKKSTDNEFYEAVEHTLLKDENFKRKAIVIEELREMTSKVLHYYKGDLLDELPGLVDFSVFLNLTPKQKIEVKQLRTLGMRFKISPDGSAIYVHPCLKSVVKNNNKEKRDDNISKIDELLETLDVREGVKAKFYLNLLRLCENGGEKLLVFGQYKLPLKFLLRLTMKMKGWKLGKELFMITGDDHDNDERKITIEKFNNSPDSRVFFGSIKACGEGISLVGASRIIILDVHLNPSVTRQAIGRAFRPGQVRKVYTYRLIAAESPEEEDHVTCFKKESIAKMWFEWNEYCGDHNFEMKATSVGDCGDSFLKTAWLNEDVTAVYKR